MYHRQRIYKMHAIRYDFMRITNSEHKNGLDGFSSVHVVQGSLKVLNLVSGVSSGTSGTLKSISSLAIHTLYCLIILSIGNLP